MVLEPSLIVPYLFSCRRGYRQLWPDLQAQRGLLATTRKETGRIVMQADDKDGRAIGQGRQALAVEELSDAEIDSISCAEALAEAAQYDRELTEGQRAASSTKPPPLPLLPAGAERPE